MSNEIIPQGTPPGTFLEQLNVPKLIAGPAGEALSRLVGGAVDIPAAWMQQVAQGIRDKTEAKSKVSSALAEAASDLVRNDPELVQRAAHAFVSKQIRRQTNRESIARKTVEILQEGSKADKTEAKPIEEDWMNVFEKFAEDASSERLQDLWARVLAGQLKRPKSFSLQTLRYISELDETVAALFEKHATAVVWESFVPFGPRQGPEFSELLQLEEFGLISGATGILQKTFEVAQPGVLQFPYKHSMMSVVFSGACKVQISSFLLTRVGQEIYRGIDIGTDPMRAQHFAHEFPKDNVDAIYYIDFLTAKKQIALWLNPKKTQ